MALDHLLEALSREAGATAERLRAEARTEAARIAALSDALAGRQVQQEVDRAVRDRRERVEIAVAAARHAARKDVLDARARLLGRVDRAVRAACPAALADPRIQATLSAHLAPALAYFPDEASVSARCAPTLSGPLRAAWPASRTGKVRPDQGIGSGFRLTGGDGRIEVEVTLEGRLEAQRAELEREALRRLEVEA